jgi:hypothetical protein
VGHVATISAIDDGRRLALVLNIGCDLGDLIATFLEWRDDDLPAVAALGCLIVQSAGIATWSTVLRSIDAPWYPPRAA